MRKIIAQGIGLALAMAVCLVAFPRNVVAADDMPQIHTGMTEAEVQKLYGEPDTTTETQNGTMWSYTKGMGKAMIPFYGLFSHPIKVVVITFRKGRVVSYAAQH
jgi:outer membrane protein assembly factor BamE (lipoprotein component of BamABCDE complex)